MLLGGGRCFLHLQSEIGECFSQAGHQLADLIVIHVARRESIELGQLYLEVLHSLDEGRLGWVSECCEGFHFSPEI